MEILPTESVAIYSPNSIKKHKAIPVIKATSIVIFKKIYWMRAVWGLLIPNFRATCTYNQKELSEWSPIVTLWFAMAAITGIATTKLMVFFLGFIPLASFVLAGLPFLIKSMFNKTKAVIRSFQKEVADELTKMNNLR